MLRNRIRWSEMCLGQLEMIIKILIHRILRSFIFVRIGDFGG